VKSSRRRTRRSAGNTCHARTKPTARRVPCCGATKESTGPHGCACAAESRASLRADDCSAGTCACSLRTPTTGPKRRRTFGTHKRPVKGAHLPRYGRTRSQVKRARGQTILGKPAVKATRRGARQECGCLVEAAPAVLLASRHRPSPNRPSRRTKPPRPRRMGLARRRLKHLMIHRLWTEVWMRHRFRLHRVQAVRSRERL
jgi:hypothetical protein